MLCLINILTSIVSAYAFAILILGQLAASIVAIYYGYQIQEELALKSFSSFLAKGINDVSSKAAVISGSFAFIMSILGFIMLSPIQRKWMYYVYQPITILSFAVMFSTGLYLIYAGNTGAGLLQDYCSDNFERWT
jgi:hypothetical protein